MNIPWKSWLRKAIDYALVLIRATGPTPSQGDAPPPTEPSATEAFDKWKDGRP